jgi:hypothetical protein
VNAWISVSKQMPEAVTTYLGFQEKPYVLAVDAKNRMSIGYVVRYQDGRHRWTFAKPIGEVTHWQPLPKGPWG